MRIFTSYFYQVRFFTPNVIPLSTAFWDPKWFHAFHDQSHIFRDSRGVLNGMRYPLLMPGKSCEGECSGKDNCNINDPTQCNFLKNYRAQLEAIDFQWFLNQMESIANGTAQILDLHGDVNICLMVHEAPNNPCSERVAIQQWFLAHKHPIAEWSKLCL